MILSAKERAQVGLALLKEAVVQELERSPKALQHAEIVRRLDIPSDFEGTGKNYLSWSVLGLLVNDNVIRYRGDRNERIYFVRDDQL